MSVKNLIGQDLSNFKIVEMTEVYFTDLDGHPVQTQGVFKSPDVANAYAETRPETGFYKTRQVAVLTNDAVGFVIHDGNMVPLLNDETESKTMKEKALNTLSPAVRTLFEQR